eukprot:comp24010_c0_seq3/m.42831 comp24010_c0_seq3/g.42831  ORF comp24010_c0_seq3/g.42831 comp24010_c0_seq3/m.42831 type:complete len:112 (-) comp24010_c0_seq3:818-1153(-)
MDLLTWDVGDNGCLLDLDLVGPFADFDADLTLPLDLPAPTEPREGQVKRSLDQDEGARKRQNVSAAELLASLAKVEAQTQRPWTDSDLGSGGCCLCEMREEKRVGVVAIVI